MGSDGNPSDASGDPHMKKEREDHVEDMRRIREQMLASTSGIFDQVRKSSLALGSTLSAFDRLTRDKVAITFGQDAHITRSSGS
jgi:hypothetical protein